MKSEQEQPERIVFDSSEEPHERSDNNSLMIVRNIDSAHKESSLAIIREIVNRQFRVEWVEGVGIVISIADTDHWKYVWGSISRTIPSWGRGVILEDVKTVSYAIEMVGHQMDRKLEVFGRQMDRKLEVFGHEMDRKLEVLGHEMDRKLEVFDRQMDRKLEVLDHQMDRKIDVIRGILDEPGKEKEKATTGAVSISTWVNGKDRPMKSSGILMELSDGDRARFPLFVDIQYVGDVKVAAGAKHAIVRPGLRSLKMVVARDPTKEIQVQYIVSARDHDLAFLILTDQNWPGVFMKVAELTADDVGKRTLGYGGGKKRGLELVSGTITSVSNKLALSDGIGKPGMSGVGGVISRRDANGVSTQGVAMILKGSIMREGDSEGEDEALDDDDYDDQDEFEDATSTARRLAKRMDSTINRCGCISSVPRFAMSITTAGLLSSRTSRTKWTPIKKALESEGWTVKQAPPRPEDVVAMPAEKRVGCCRKWICDCLSMVFCCSKKGI
jgi:hypothetical protein